MLKIYIGHSREFDFKKELYEPIRASSLNSSYKIALPHENSDLPFNSREYLKDCDCMIAEVSYPSIGLGIELGWANTYGCRIVCLNKLGFKVSGSLKVVSTDFIEYEDSKVLIKQLETLLSGIKGKSD